VWGFAIGAAVKKLSDQQQIQLTNAQLSDVAAHGPGRVRTVKLISTGGTTHPCNDGHPGSLVELRHNDAVASLIWVGSTAPFSGSAYTR
jgi:hypothetical protein